MFSKEFFAYIVDKILNDFSNRCTDMGFLYNEVSLKSLGGLEIFRGGNNHPFIYQVPKTSRGVAASK